MRVSRQAAGLTQAVRAAIGGGAEPRPRRTLRIPWRALGGAVGAGALVAAGSGRGASGFSTMIRPICPTSRGSLNVKHAPR